MSYSPTIGRFVQADPAGYVDEMNLYQLEGSNPVNQLDPTGLKKIVIAFEGKRFAMDAAAAKAASAVEQNWEPLVTADLDAEWHYFAQDEVDKALELAMQHANPVNVNGTCVWDTIVILGFSNGAHAAKELADKLEHKKVTVDYVVTVDPVRKPGRISDWHRPTNVLKWDNYYQQGDLLLGDRFRGNEIVGADSNVELIESDFNEFLREGYATDADAYHHAHQNLLIPRQSKVLAGIKDALKNTDPVRTKKC